MKREIIFQCNTGKGLNITPKQAGKVDCLLYSSGYVREQIILEKNLTVTPS